ncbi:hypothetical protein M426DRAFT_323472 [Hypoxylon sp. CI-4A]|nr:hypothetical protein M426DRAFT_323472 [Hypoxylon sp. CI-4A]
MRTANYGHVILGAGPYGLSTNDTSTKSSTSSPATTIRRESPSHDVVTNTNGFRDGYHLQAPLAHNPPFCTPPPPSSQPPRPTLPLRKPLQPGFGLTWSQAEQAISNFRAKFIPFFPFVVLDHDVPAQEILSKKPLLFRAIMLVAAQLTLARQKEIRKSILAYIGQHLLVMEERNLGLLQGILVFIAWGEQHFYFDQKITYLTYLAMGYAHNLAITRPPPTTQQKMMVAVHPKDAKEAIMGHNLTSVLEESHTPEEQRAFLGCQYLLSMNSSQFGRDSVLKGDYVNRCLNSLVRPTTWDADFVLDKIIRFQQIVEQIMEKLYIPSNLDGTRVFTVAMSNEMQSIRDELNQLFNNVSRENRQFVLFWAMHSYVLVRLYLPASNLSSPPDEVAAQQQRQCMLYCLQAASTFFTTILSMGPEAFLYRSFASFSEILFVLVAASRLLLVEIEGWDLAEARRMLDFPANLEGIITIFKDTSVLQRQRAREDVTAFGPDDGDRFYQYATKLQWIKDWFETQLSNELHVPSEPQATSSSGTWAPENQSWNPFMFGFLGDDNWNIEF